MRTTAKSGKPGIGDKTADAKKQGRDEKGRFAKGNKSNGGRPKMPEEIREAFQKACPDALEVLIAIMSNERAKDTDRIRAAEVILDRGYGKAPQSIDLDAGGAIQIELIDEIYEDGA